MSSTRPSRSYQHPGYAFLNRFGSLQTEADVYDYVDFLRQAAQLDDRLPVDLDRIFTQFGMPIPLRVALDDQQGILLDSDRGVILIREGDSVERQRFTEGHELMELLFDAQDRVTQELQLQPWPAARKEKLCDAGAAELLMPKQSFQRHLQHLGTSLATGQSLSRLYQTSLMATLIRMVELTGGEHALICWQFVQNAEGARLRTEWSVVSEDWKQGFIPKAHFISADVLMGNLTDPLQTAKTSQNPRSSRPKIKLAIDDWSVDCRVEVWRIPAQNPGTQNPGVLSFVHI
jgi:Zn-dependent peptidase ImmA (M78 family)